MKTEMNNKKYLQAANVYAQEGPRSSGTPYNICLTAECLKMSISLSTDHYAICILLTDNGCYYQPSTSISQRLNVNKHIQWIPFSIRGTQFS